MDQLKKQALAEHDLLLVRSTLSEHPEEPAEVFCSRCGHEIEEWEATATEALGVVVHAGCAPVPPPCPLGIDPELWADGVLTLCHPTHESEVAWELRLRLFAQLFGPAFARNKAARAAAKETNQ